MITIVDNEMGNIQSVSNALNQLDIENIASRDPSIILNSKGLILPGVGAFPMAMDNLERNGLDKLLVELINKEIPILGICLGMQLLFEESEEKGLCRGLGVLKGKVKKISKTDQNSVPHVGWNVITITKNNPLTKNLNDESRFYYDHSYYVDETSSKTIASLDYGDQMCVAVNYKNIFGVQFHPEKSQRNGLRLLRNFDNYIKKIK